MSDSGYPASDRSECKSSTPLPSRINETDISQAVPRTAVDTTNRLHNRLTLPGGKLYHQAGNLSNGGFIHVRQASCEYFHQGPLPQTVAMKGPPNAIYASSSDKIPDTILNGNVMSSFTEDGGSQRFPSGYGGWSPARHSRELSSSVAGDLQKREQFAEHESSEPSDLGGDAGRRKVGQMSVLKYALYMVHLSAYTYVLQEPVKGELQDYIKAPFKWRDN